MKAGDQVRLLISIRTWDGTLWPKGAICEIQQFRYNGLRLSKGLRRIRGVPVDAVELIK